LRVDLYHIVRHGSEAASRAPLLQVDHLMVGLKIISLWRHKIDLNEIVIDRPSIHLSVDQNGRSNLAQTPPPAAGGRRTNILDLAIGHFVVNQGELDYNDRHIPLDGEVHDLHAQVSFDSAKTEYDGMLGYRDGRVQYGGFNPVQHGMQVRFGATPSGLTLDSLVLIAGSSTMSVQAHLQDYGNPSVDGSYRADLSTRDLVKILKVNSIPAGQVNLQGTLYYQNRTDHPFLDNISTAGQFRSPDLALNMPQVHANVRALTGEYRLSGGTLEARNVQADVLGGKMLGNLTLTHLSERPVARVAAAVHDVSLEAISAALDTRPLERAAISGSLDGTIAGSWERSGQNVQLRADVTIAASAPARQGAGSGTNVIPLRGDLHVAYAAQTGVIALSRSDLTTSHSTLKFDGSTGKQSSLAIQAQSDDLREVDQIQLIVRHAMEGSRPSSPTSIAPLGIAGSGSFDGQLRGSMTDLHLTGQLSSTNFHFRDTTLSELQVNVVLSPSGVTLSKGELQTSERGQVQFDAAAGLTNWAYTPQSPVRLDITAERVPVASLEQLANLHYPVTGTLAAHLSTHGSQSDAIGQGTATLTQATVWGQPIQKLSVQFQGAGDTIHSTLQLSTPAGSGSGKLTYDFRNQSYDAQFSLANIQLQQLEAIRYKNVQVSGVATASLQGRGTLKDPQFTATFQAPKLVIAQQTLDGLKLHADMAHQQASFDLVSAAVGASIQARGAVTLNANYSTQATIDVRNIQLAALLAAFLPQIPSEVRGQAELHGTLHGPLKLRDQLEAEVDIPTLSLTYRSLQIGNASPIPAVYRGGVISLERCELKGTGTDLQVQAAVPLEHAQNLQASATGNVDLHLVQMLYPDWDSSGQVRLDVNAEGTFTHPDVNGTVHLIGAAFQAPDTPLGAQNVNAALAIKNGRVDIQSFTGETGGGTLSAQGFATYQPAIQFNVALTARKVRLRYPVGTRAILDGNLVLTGSGDSALLSGRVLVDRLSLTKEFDLSTFADQFTGSSSPSVGSKFAQNVNLNVSLTSASEMALASSKLSVQGSANLMVRGTAAEPVILGRSDITGGEIFFNGNRYKVESGVIQFVNPVRTEPVVNILVTTTVNQFNLSMNFTGPIDRLRTTYTSDPPLAPIDIINFLATGQTTEAASTGSTSPESVIAGQLTSQFSSRVEKLAGITSLTIDPQVGGAQGNGGGRLAVQQRVTKNLFFTFSTDVTTSTGQIVQIEYQVSQRFAVSTIRDQNGGYTVQIKVHKRF
jgi:translocation and assembly module TamB